MLTVLLIYHMNWQKSFFTDIPNKRTFSRKRERFKEYLDSLNAFYSKIENL